ncbi:TPA: arsenical pump-driving ATPase [Yersinia enterocolitica]|nr:arsenical pump-driving ATPase [Yersinia frederiksenii]
MSDVKAFNNCMSVFWRQHEAEFSRFLTSKTGDSEKAADPEKTKVIIVTLAETTPVLEAANLQQDLRRAGIEPWAWVVNNSLAAAQVGRSKNSLNEWKGLPLIMRLINSCAIMG